MTRPVKPKMPAVVIGPHAFTRWLERANRKPRKKRSLAALVGTILYTKLKRGMEVEGLEVCLDMNRVTAVLILGETGWVVVTFLDEGMGVKEAGMG